MQPQEPHEPLKNYDFILNPEKPAKKPILPLPGKGSSMLQRLVFVGGGFMALLLVLVVGYSLLFGGPKLSDDITSLAATQTEIIRVSELASTAAKQPETKAFAATTSSVVQSDLADLTKQAKAARITVNTGLLSSKKSTATDAALKAAETSDTFDEVFTETITKQLTDYSEELSRLYSKVDTQKLKDSLASALASSKLLLEQ